MDLVSKLAILVFEVWFGHLIRAFILPVWDIIYIEKMYFMTLSSA